MTTNLNLDRAESSKAAAVEAAAAAHRQAVAKAVAPLFVKVTGDADQYDDVAGALFGLLVSTAIAYCDAIAGAATEMAFAHAVATMLVGLEENMELVAEDRS